MIESELAKQWASMPDFPTRMSSWTWFKSAVGECLAVTAQRLQFRCELRSADLADAFFHWAGYADSHQDFSQLDPVDYAHYACGVLLGSLMQANPISVIDRQADGVGAGGAGSAEKPPLDLTNQPEDLVMLCLTLTFLQSWRLHLGAEPLVINLDLIKRHWNSFHENAKEDAFSSVSFLDLFLGLPPVWEYPMIAGNRPAMQLAYARRNSNQSNQSNQSQST